MVLLSLFQFEKRERTQSPSFCYLACRWKPERYIQTCIVSESIRGVESLNMQHVVMGKWMEGEIQRPAALALLVAHINENVVN